MAWLGQSFAGRLSAAAGGSDRRPEAVGLCYNRRQKVTEMNMLDIPKSGRYGDVVFLMRGGTQSTRAYVIPEIVRNAATRRARGAFGALSKAFSTLLTDEQQEAWIAAAAKVLSHPRLYQCGPLTGQQHFVGINSARARIGRECLLWPPAPVAFGPNPVAALTLRYVDGRLRLELKLSGPVAEDIMVFARAPCRPGWKKWRHGTCLGLLPAPQDGISDITSMYLERFGEPEPGRKVFIRTRQQRQGWEGQAKDLSELVPVNPLASQSRTGVPLVQSPLSKPCRISVPVCPGHRFPTQPLPVRLPCHRPMPDPCTRGLRRTATIATPVQYRSGAGCPGPVRQIAPMRRLCPMPEPRRSGHWRELWRGG